MAKVTDVSVEIENDRVVIWRDHIAKCSVYFHVGWASRRRLAKVVNHLSESHQGTMKVQACGWWFHR